MENTEEAWPSRQRQDRYIDGLREVAQHAQGLHKSSPEEVSEVSGEYGMMSHL